ncbi:hypothetical protein INR49_011972 [Caranx melampygus]|nr:hypothetical protein INR49_011972 [Caranx melampygus]
MAPLMSPDSASSSLCCSRPPTRVIEPQLSSDWNHNLTSLTAPKSPRYRTDCDSIQLRVQLLQLDSTRASPGASVLLMTPTGETLMGFYYEFQSWSLAQSWDPNHEVLVMVMVPVRVANKGMKEKEKKKRRRRRRRTDRRYREKEDEEEWMNEREERDGRWKEKEEMEN